MRNSEHRLLQRMNGVPVRIRLFKLMQTYEKLYVITEAIKILVKKLNVSKPPAEIEETLKMSQEFYDTPQFFKLCKRCKGKCCWEPIPPIGLYQIIYWCVLDKDFQFPLPKWPYLARRVIQKRGSRTRSLPCLFLSAKGCVLKKRSLVCLEQKCIKMSHLIHKIQKQPPSLVNVGVNFQKWLNQIYESSLPRLWKEDSHSADLAELIFGHAIKNFRINRRDLDQLYLAAEEYLLVL